MTLLESCRQIVNLVRFVTLAKRGEDQVSNLCCCEAFDAFFVTCLKDPQIFVNLSESAPPWQSGFVGAKREVFHLLSSP